MPYSTGCKTPLSNFEAGMAYKVCHALILFPPFFHVIPFAWTEITMIDCVGCF